MTTTKSVKSVAKNSTPEYLKEIAKVESTFLGIEDHGILTATVGFKLGSGSYQSTPGYGFDVYNGERADPKPAPEYPQDRVGSRFGMEFIRRLLEAFGVDEWDKIRGRTVYVLREEPYGFIKGIEPLPTEGGKRFIFDELGVLGDN